MEKAILKSTEFDSTDVITASVPDPAPKYTVDLFGLNDDIPLSMAMSVFDNTSSIPVETVITKEDEETGKTSYSPFVKLLHTEQYKFDNVPDEAANITFKNSGGGMKSLEWFWSQEIEEGGSNVNADFEGNYEWKDGLFQWVGALHTQQ